MILGGGFEGIVYRAVHPQFMRTAGLDLGSTFAFGRFNRQNDRALYTALDPETAFLEYQQGEKRPKPCLVIALEVKLHQHVNFSGGYVAKTWKAHWRSALDPHWRLKAEKLLAAGNEWAGWRCGDQVRAAGHAGLLVPSMRNVAKSGQNLILYQDVKAIGQYWNDIDDYSDVIKAMDAITKIKT